MDFTALIIVRNSFYNIFELEFKFDTNIEEKKGLIFPFL